MAGIAHITHHLSLANSAEEKFRLAVEACPSGMVMTDGGGRIVLVNQETERLFGYERDELIGQPIEILIPERLRNVHLQHRNSYAHRQETRRMGARKDFLGRRRDGSEFPVEIGLSPIRTRDGLLVLSVIGDISERKRLERLKDDFVSTVSHELRTPLTSIAGSLGLLIGGAAGDLPETAARLIRIAQSNSQRLVRLINDILDIEKIESGQIAFNFKRLSARTLVEQVIEASRGYADSFQIRVRFDASGSSSEVYADPDRLAQVVTNLLSNATKFSPPGTEVLVTVNESGESVCIGVRDHGHGIPLEFRPRIFEKFAQADATETRQKGGTGLGLSIVKQIVSRLGGTVGFEDASGGGTRFWVELPAWAQVAARDANTRPQEAPSANGRPQILHVDDDPDVLEIVAAILDSAAGVVSVDTLEEARCALLEHQFDLAIVDIRMGAVSGLDLLPDLRSGKGSPIPVIVFSAHGADCKGDLQVEAQLNKSSATSLKELVAAVRERLPPRPARVSKEAV